MDAELDSFREAFSPPVGLCRHDCRCGKIYYDSLGSVDWEDGELEQLEKKGIGCEGSLGLVQFEGNEYCWECDCWHERAERIIQFIKGHNLAIAKFLRIEKERQIKAADALPTFDE